MQKQANLNVPRFKTNQINWKYCLLYLEREWLAPATFFFWRSPSCGGWNIDIQNGPIKRVGYNWISLEQAYQQEGSKRDTLLQFCGQGKEMSGEQWKVTETVQQLSKKNRLSFTLSEKTPDKLLYVWVRSGKVMEKSQFLGCFLVLVSYVNGNEHNHPDCCRGCFQYPGCHFLCKAWHAFPCCHCSHDLMQQ